MAIEHVDIPEAELHEPKGVSVATSGRVYVTDGAGSGNFQELVTPSTLPEDIRKVYVADGLGGGSWKLPTRMGLWDYNDLATASSPITLSPIGVAVQMTNDGLGQFTNKEFKLPEVDEVWNTVTNQLDFTGLKKGDVVDFRIDLEVTTSGVNHEIDIGITLGIGGFPYSLSVFSRNVKAAGTVQGTYMFSIYMGDDNTLLNPGQITVSSDTGTSDTVKVNGWFIEVTSRGED